MNFQCKPVYEPLRVLIFNALSPTAKLIIAKIMSGIVFGESQLIDLFIIVYSNEVDNAEGLKTEVEACAFSCMNSIRVSSDLPRETEESFDSLYLLTKLANNFIWPEEKNDDDDKDKRFLARPKTAKKPIFVTDGLIAIDILNSLSKNMPTDIFFCPTPISAIGKAILAEYLNVQCSDINDLLVWAANDEVFHVEVEKPLVIHKRACEHPKCEPGMVRKDFLESLNLDPTQFNATWMKKDFIEKILASASKNPYGSIYKAAEFTKTLRDVWRGRNEREFSGRYNMGVISDGSLGTTKGIPYVLPIIMKGESWSVNTNYYEESTHLKQELKRINETVKNHHKKLVTHCKRFLEENVINQAFIPSDVDSGSVY